MNEYTDEEGLIINMKATELCLKIARLTWNWDNWSEPIKVGYELMDQIGKLSVEISEYQQRTDSKINMYYRNKINNTMTNLEKLLPYMRNKMRLKNEIHG